MAYHQMSAAELREFLVSTPAHLATLATVRADGRPHAAPVWFDVDDGGDLVFMTGEGTVKGRNLAREGRAAVSVADARPPFAFALIEGPVEVSEDPEELLRWGIRIGGRYMGADRAEEYGARNAVPGELLVRLHPAKVTTAADLTD
jgi:PPOX class probable F420-dependent enzyme